MSSKNNRLDIQDQREFVENLRNNEISIPNLFTIEMGKLIKNAREERGLTQIQLAESLSRRQATISDIENGKIEIGILTLVQISQVFHKPISYFMPVMEFFSNLTDVQNKWEEEALTHFKEIERFGDVPFTLKFLKMLEEYYFDEFERGIENDGMPFIPDEEDL